MKEQAWKWWARAYLAAGKGWLSGKGLALQILEENPVCSKQPWEIGINGYLSPRRIWIPCSVNRTRDHPRGLMPKSALLMLHEDPAKSRQVESRGACSEPTGLGWEEAGYHCSAPGWYQSMTLFYHCNFMLLWFLYMFLSREKKKVFSINLFCSVLFFSHFFFCTLLDIFFYSSSVLLLRA